MGEPSLKDRSGTAEEWSASDFILPNGMIGRVDPTGRIKYGDGVSVFDDLPWPEDVESEDSLVTESRVLELIAENVAVPATTLVEDFDEAIASGSYLFATPESALVMTPPANMPEDTDLAFGMLIVAASTIDVDGVGPVLSVFQQLTGLTADGSIEVWARTLTEAWTDWTQPSLSGGTP